MTNDTGDEKRPLPTNMRRNRQETDKRLLVLVIFMLVVVGGALIGLIFGWEAGRLKSLPFYRPFSRQIVYTIDMEPMCPALLGHHLN